MGRAAKRGGKQTAALPAGRGLDWLNLFVANVQTGFGPFIAVYLTTRGWTQTSIGLALSFGTITAMIGQVPAGALVDAIANKTRVVLFSILAFSISALLFAVQPAPLAVYVAEMIYSFSSCTLGPAIAAISLTIAGPAMRGLRFGRNARFASIGNGIGAALMGAAGYYVSERAVFFLTAALTLPALVPLLPLARLDYRGVPAGGIDNSPARREAPGRLLRNRALLTFAVCTMLFTLGNAAMLPLVGNALTKTVGGAANLVIAACIMLPQLVVAVISPTIGRLAETNGRRSVLLLGFCTLPIRGLLFAVVTDPDSCHADTGIGRHRCGMSRRHGAARHQRRRRPIRPFQSIARVHRLCDGDRRDTEHQPRRLGRRPLRAPDRLRNPCGNGVGGNAIGLECNAGNKVSDEPWPPAEPLDAPVLLIATIDQCAAAQPQGVSSARRLLGQLLTSLVSTSVR